MTSAENPADVIEQAAQVVFDYKPAAPMVIARALHAAGLLADPACRSADEFNGVVDAAIRQKRRANDATARAERAEAEVAELRATIDDVWKVLDAYGAFDDEENDECDLPWRFVRDIRAALGGAGNRRNPWRQP